LESNTKAAIKNIVNQNTLAITGNGAFPSSGIDVKGYNTFFFYTAGTFNGTAISVRLYSQNIQIQNPAVKIFDMNSGQEVLNITAAGYYYIAVKGFDTLYFIASSYGGNPITVSYNYSLAELMQIMKIESYYEKQFTAFNNFTGASGYSGKVIVNGGVNTAIVYVQVTGGTPVIVGERRTADSTTWIYDQAGQIYNSKFEPIDSISSTGLYFIDIRGAEVFYLYCTSNPGATINARIKTSLVNLPVNYDTVRKTIFNAQASNGYSSAITRSLRHKFIKLDIRGSYDGTFYLAGRYSDTTDRKITLYNQNGLAFTDVKGEGIFYADISLWATLYGVLVYNTVNSLTVYAELLENAVIPSSQQCGENGFERYGLFAKCSYAFQEKWFNSYYNTFAAHNLSKYVAVEIYFKNSIDNTTTNLVRVEPGERISLKVSNKNIVGYRSVVGTADIIVYAGNINLSTLPPVARNINADIIAGNIPLDVKGNYIVTVDQTNKYIIYFSNDCSRTTLKNYSFNSSEVIDFAFIYPILNLSEVDIIVHGTTNGWYKIKNAFNSNTISVSAIPTLNSPAAFNGVEQPIAWKPYSNGFHSMDTANSGMTLMFGEYVSVLNNNDPNIRIFRSTDGGDTWTIWKSISRGWRDSNNPGLHHKILSVDAGNKQLTIEGDITSLCYAGQTAFVLNPSTGSLVNITALSYDNGTGHTSVTISETPDAGWINSPLNGIRHIHTCKYNSYNRQFYITTGDNDNECIWMNADIDLTSLTMIKALDGTQTWRTISQGFDSNGNIYWGCDSKFRMTGISRVKIGEWIPESIFQYNSEIYVFNFDANVMITATASNGNNDNPESNRTMKLMPEIYISKDLGKSWEKIFEWKPASNEVGGFIAMLGKDGEGNYYFFGNALSSLYTSNGTYVSGVKINL
ncbi:MAG: hypothetical protein P4L45_00470, partial [Ignavibacteriaceae bacterium]|nr:hypothetical protein [Ignavibacteriaceae bacterium]